jgi:hypothetical protein
LLDTIETDQTSPKTAGARRGLIPCRGEDPEIAKFNTLRVFAFSVCAKQRLETFNKKEVDELGHIKRTEDQIAGRV